MLITHRIRTCNQKFFQISMDGPNVNKTVQLIPFEKLIIEFDDSSELLNIGICSLYIAQGAYKRAMVKPIGRIPERVSPECTRTTCGILAPYKAMLMKRRAFKIFRSYFLLKEKYGQLLFRPTFLSANRPFGQLSFSHMII